MNLESLCQEFWKNGYLVLDDFFAPERMDDVYRQIRGHFGDNPAYRHEAEFLEKSRTEVIPWFPQNPDLPGHSPEAAGPFDRLEADPRLQTLTTALLGENWKPFT